MTWRQTVNPKYRLANRAECVNLARGDRRVHFLHVHKCGGTTLRYVLEGFAATRGLVAVNGDRATGGVLPDLSSGTVVYSHRRPHDAPIRPDTCYFTVLRHPVRRLRSLVSMLSRQRERSWSEVVESLSWADANYAVHMLTGAAGPDGDPVRMAKRLLDSQVSLFGFQEQLDEFMALLSAMLEVRGIVYPEFQYTPKAAQLDGRYDDLFTRMAAADLELFDFARSLYAERFAPLIAPEELNVRREGQPYLIIRLDPETLNVDVSEAVFST